MRRPRGVVTRDYKLEGRHTNKYKLPTGTKPVDRLTVQSRYNLFKTCDGRAGSSGLLQMRNAIKFYTLRFK